MKILALKRFLPAPLNAVLAILSAILLIIAFPDFEFWFLAWFALAPLFFAVEREKESWIKSLFVGWIFGTCFFFGSCWWLTFAPITYAGFPFLLAYSLLFPACLAVGFFPAIFAALFSMLLKRFGSFAILSAPFLWTAIEFLRFWTTGNNWNAIAYSQFDVSFIIQPAKIGGIYLICFLIILMNAIVFYQLLSLKKLLFDKETTSYYLLTGLVIISFLIILLPIFPRLITGKLSFALTQANVIAVQPNVPMSGLNYEKWRQLRRKHVELAENALQKLNAQPTGDRLQGASFESWFGVRQ